MRENGKLMVLQMITTAWCEEAGFKIVSKKRFYKGKITKIYLLNVCRESDFKINKCNDYYLYIE